MIQDTQWNVASMWKDESLTNRRDVYLKFNFLIPLEIFALSYQAQKALCWHMQTYSCMVWLLFPYSEGLHGSASPGTLKLRFHNAQIQLQWAVRKMPTSVETRIAHRPARPPELSGVARAQSGVAAPPHLDTWWVELGQQPWALQMTAWCGLDLLLR